MMQDNQFLRIFANLQFEKWHGAGNDFLFAGADEFFSALRVEQGGDQLERLIQCLCHRTMGLGADGVVLWRWNANQELEAGIWNSDGSRAGTCGNALRCLAALCFSKKSWDGQYPASVFALTLHDGHFFEERSEKRSPFATMLESKKITNLVGRYRSGIAMGQVQNFRVLPLSDLDPILPPDSSPTVRSFRARLKNMVFVQLANPHLVMVLEPGALSTVTEVKIKEVGAFFQSARVCDALQIPLSNIGFVELPFKCDDTQPTAVDWNAVVYERGAGLTACCGSGGCAMHVALSATKQISQELKLRLAMPGGVIEIQLSPESQLELFGPAQKVCQIQTTC